MEKRALKKSLCWFIVLALPLVLILAVVPCAAEETHTLQGLWDKTDNGGIITIDKMEFSNFVVENVYPKDDTGPNLGNIFLVTFGEGTLNPGLRFVLNGELSISETSTVAKRLITISYTAKPVEGYLIEGKSLILDRLTAISGTKSFINVREDFRKEADPESDVIGGVLHELKATTLAESSKVTPDTPQAVLFPVITVSSYVYPSGQALIDGFEQKFNLDSGGPIANAGPDQAVLDQVSLDGSASSPADAVYQWELWKVGDDSGPVDSAPGVQAEFTILEYGIYEARLTVTNAQGVSAVDTALIAAAGPSGGGTEPGAPAELNLWDFTLKKYRYCKWSTARLLGTFNFPDDVEFHRGDDLVGKVTIQLNRAGEPVVVMSDDIKLRVSNWRYKLEISKH